MCEVWEGCTRGPTCYIFLLVLGLPLVLVVLVLPLVLVVQSPTLLLRCGTATAPAQAHVQCGLARPPLV